VVLTMAIHASEKRIEFALDAGKNRALHCNVIGGRI
jgi:hypothetical protein